MKKTKKYAKHAFTLAEVLITLVIIGVIAALTVPALIQNTQKQEYVSALKKTYSTLSQVTQQIIAEEGSPKGESGWINLDIDEIYKLFKKHLNISKDCRDTSCRTYSVQYLGGGTSSFKGRLILNDGVLFSISDKFPNCNYMKNDTWINAGSDYVCGFIRVDVNGEKGPNIHGRDLFMFVIKENGLYPAGCDDVNVCADGVRAGNFGWGCTCKVLREGAMNY